MDKEVLIKQRDENFKQLGQYMLQKLYYEEKIKFLLQEQQMLINNIFAMK